jgi:predicted nucleic acid-binding protein
VTDDEADLQAVLRDVLDQRQVTDAYLAAQARRRGGALATFDRGFVASHPDVGVFVPT